MRSARLLVGFLPFLVFGQGLEYVKAHYTKYEYRIPMRDGVRLATAVYAPKDTSRTYPVMLTRTPYSLQPYGPDRYRESLGPSELFAKSGYIFVYQDVRGRWMSEGEFQHLRPHKPVKSGPRDTDESTDTYDTIDWLLKNVRGNNGRVGIWGISYPGFYTVHGVFSGHPALKAASPQAPVTDMWVGDDFHHNGAFFLTHAFNFLMRNDRPGPHEPTKTPVEPFNHGTPSAYEFFLRAGPLSNLNEKYLKNRSAFWNEMMRHSEYNEYWQARDIRRHLKGIRPAMLTVGGWFDAEDLFGPLRVYESAEKGGAAGQNLLVMGPWYHGQWSNNDGERLGFVEFNAKTSLFYREKIEFPFFEHHLKGAVDPELPEAYVFETGRNQWRAHTEWPPKRATPRTFYFGAGWKLTGEPPAEAGADEYISDPAKPVPVVDYESTGMTREYMVDDQRFASRRPDVLTYDTGVLAEDLTLAGPLKATLHVSITGTDADFVVKLVDVYPDDYPDPNPNPRQMRMGGYQMLVRGEPIRGRFRNNFSKAEPFEPGKMTKVEFELPDVYHTFRAGHRVMVQVQSTWFPLIDRNPQKFVDIANAKEADFQKAVIRVHRGRGQASGLTVMTLAE
jgi:putative CocE/NonD family hydrolase